MSDIQDPRQEAQVKFATQIIKTIFPLLILKWILIFGLSRWARSLR